MISGRERERLSCLAHQRDIQEEIATSWIAFRCLSQRFGRIGVRPFSLPLPPNSQVCSERSQIYFGKSVRSRNPQQGTKVTADRKVPRAVHRAGSELLNSSLPPQPTLCRGIAHSASHFCGRRRSAMTDTSQCVVDCRCSGSRCNMSSKLCQFSNSHSVRADRRPSTRRGRSNRSIMRCEEIL